MENIQQDIVSWFKTLKGWQQELAYRLLTKPGLLEEDLNDIIEMLKGGTPFNNKDFPNVGVSILGNPTCIVSIDSVNDIEQLSPRNPLVFAENGITVVYGNNGTGKSGYTRILKKVCGKPHSRDLVGNIYKAENNVGQCALSYKLNNTLYQCVWNINDPAIENLRCVDIFDTDTGSSYINEANSVSYVPPVIRFFSAFSKYHDVIKEKLIAEKGALNSLLPIPPKELGDSKFIKEIYYASQLDISKFTWDDHDNDVLTTLEDRLKVSDPRKTAEEFKERKKKLDILIKDLETALQCVSQQSADEIIQLRSNAEVKRKAVEDSKTALADHAKLDEIGSQSWKELWKAALEYAQIAYNNNNPLHQQERCVLCNQILDHDSKERLQAFGAFVDDKLSKEAEMAKQKYDERIQLLPQQATQESINDRCIVAGLDADWGYQIFQIWSLLVENAEAICSGRILANISEIVNTAISALKAKSDIFNTQIEQYEKDAESIDREALILQVINLKARKWSTDQLEYIKLEKTRQEKVNKFNTWISAINTRGITNKATEIGDIVISQGFVERFNQELQKLGASKIRVEFIKQVSKGTTKHLLKIANITHDSPKNILSEGEARIISLAAFLADVTGGNDSNPFIFDDPISSLDQLFEEKTISRLIELSQTRQVIIFTHRISLLTQISQLGGESVKIVGIRKESWGTGEIGDTPLNAKSPKKALNTLKNEKLPKARKILEEEGSELYYPHAKMLCSDFRILIERIVESNLLADVVQRYRRAINTMGKIDKLAKITKSDCDIIDEFMTKYSCYEHSQPQEAPVNVPAPEEIAQDIDKILSWLNEFEKR